MIIWHLVRCRLSTRTSEYLSLSKGQFILRPRQRARIRILMRWRSMNWPLVCSAYLSCMDIAAVHYSVLTHWVSRTTTDCDRLLGVPLLSLQKHRFARDVGRIAARRWPRLPHNYYRWRWSPARSRSHIACVEPTRTPTGLNSPFHCTPYQSSTAIVSCTVFSDPYFHLKLHP